MCGLVGIISRRQGGFYAADMELMQNLLLLDMIRGEDSTGVFTVMRDQSVKITKVGSHPMHLYATAAWGKHRSAAIASGRMMIGHNRKATQGKINSTNAHPFVKDHVVLVHNGTLREDHKKYANVDVDSHAVCHAFADNGAEETLKTLQAAFAFIWWDAQKSKLFAVRNDERPLSIVVTDDLNILCSEPWMPEVLLRRANKKIEKTIEIKPGQLVEFSMDGTFKMSEIELRKPPVTVTQHTGTWQQRQYGQYGRHYDDRAWADLEDESVTPPKSITGSTDGLGGPTKTPFEAAAAAIVSAAPGVTNEHYKKDEVVLVQVNDASRVMVGDKLKLTGIIIEPGKPALDFVGFLPSTTTKEEAAPIIMGPAKCRIIAFSKSVCGDSAWVTGFSVADMRKLHNTDMAEEQWAYVHKNAQCKDCGNGIHDEEAPFTSVTRRGNSEYRVTCADCIETKLTGEMKDVFKQRRLDALQVGKQFSKKPTSCALTLVKPDSSPTLH